MSKLCNVFNIVKASISLVILFIAIPNTYANDKDIDTLGVLYSCDIKYCNAEVSKVIKTLFQQFHVGIRKMF